ncbi:hypothetical protein GCM10009740_02370 [Terrabacter terrae]|uniref:Uncharacterized protein n=1 Tax=Terrabacter terrae TaxID=318434 RepID=A0ABN2TT38_9MICO
MERTLCPPNLQRGMTRATARGVRTCRGPLTERQSADAGRFTAYVHDMSRWDVAPSPSQRWVAGHRKGVRSALILSIVFSLVVGTYSLVKEGFSLSIAGLALSTLGLAGSFILIGSVSRYVENWDKEHPSRESS